jgi:hypothetical protein
VREGVKEEVRQTERVRGSERGSVCLAGKG